MMFKRTFLYVNYTRGRDSRFSTPHFPLRGAYPSLAFLMKVEAIGRSNLWIVSFLNYSGNSELHVGIEPTFPRYKGGVLPLN